MGWGDYPSGSKTPFKRILRRFHFARVWSIRVGQKRLTASQSQVDLGVDRGCPVVRIARMNKINTLQYLALRRYVSAVRAVALLRHEGLLLRHEAAIRRDPRYALNWLGRLAVFVA